MCLARSIQLARRSVAAEASFDASHLTAAQGDVHRWLRRHHRRAVSALPALQAAQPSLVLQDGSICAALHTCAPVRHRWLTQCATLPLLQKHGVYACVHGPSKLLRKSCTSAAELALFPQAAHSSHRPTPPMSSIYDPDNGKSCHQCRQKTMGLRTSCSRCKSGLVSQGVNAAKQAGWGGSAVRDAAHILCIASRGWRAKIVPAGSARVPGKWQQLALCTAAKSPRSCSSCCAFAAPLRLHGLTTTPETLPAAGPAVRRLPVCSVRRACGGGAGEAG